MAEDHIYTGITDNESNLSYDNFRNISNGGAMCNFSGEELNRNVDADTVTVGSHSIKHYYNLIYQGTLSTELYLFRNSVNFSSYLSSDGKDYIYYHYVCGENITVHSG